MQWRARTTCSVHAGCPVAPLILEEAFGEFTQPLIKIEASSCMECDTTSLVTNANLSLLLSSFRRERRGVPDVAPSFLTVPARHLVCSQSFLPIVKHFMSYLKKSTTYGFISVALRPQTVAHRMTSKDWLCFGGRTWTSGWRRRCTHEWRS